MQESTKVESSTELYEKAHLAVRQMFEEIGKTHPEIIYVGIAGPFTPKNYKPGKPCIAHDKIGGVTYGSPCAHVGFISDRDSLQQHRNPLENIRVIEHAKKELKNKFGIDVIVSEVPIREYDGTLFTIREAIDYMFGPDPKDFYIAPCK